MLVKGATDSKVHGTNMGPIWGRQDPGGPHVGPVNLAVWDSLVQYHYVMFLNRESEWLPNLQRSKIAQGPVKQPWTIVQTYVSNPLQIIQNIT